MNKDINDLLSYIGEIPEELIERDNIVQEDFFPIGVKIEYKNEVLSGEENVLDED